MLIVKACPIKTLLTMSKFALSWWVLKNKILFYLNPLAYRSFGHSVNAALISIYTTAKFEEWLFESKI
jgi:hypothetical protein